MKPNESQRVLRIALLGGIAAFIAVAFAVVGYTCRDPIRIAYHRNRERAAISALQKSWTASGSSSDFDQRTLSHHREALLKLGYRQRRVFQTQYLKPGSTQTRQLFHAFQTRYPGIPYSVSWGKELAIEDIPDRMPVWEELVKKHDVPANDPESSAEQLD